MTKRVLSASFSFLILAAFPASPAQGALTLEDRVKAQRAIEEVYWRHRSWPKENGLPKPSLDAVLPRGILRARVEDSLEKSNALEKIWKRPITAADLQAEMDRMAKNTRAPEVLRELYDALGRDPALVAETLVRPLLAERRVHAEYFRAAADRTGDGFESWWAQNRSLVNSEFVPSGGRFFLPEPVASFPCALDTWSSLAGAPEARVAHSAVWTGAEMIVWGGDTGDAPWGTYFQSGGRYEAATDNWVATATAGAPSARNVHSAVWTGTEMIVWGGDTPAGLVNSGGRYNPMTDTWLSTATAGAPSARYRHTAIWTGTEMIVWGGGVVARDAYLDTDTGGRYNPSTNQWVATATAGAPSARTVHTAVWTGTRMVVWGGYSHAAQTTLQSGGRYDPASNTWLPTATLAAPQSRDFHSAFWTGQKMLIWGGEVGGNTYVNSGGRYDPVSDSWAATSLVNPPVPRDAPAVAWTGTELVVWGGYSRNTDTYPRTGARYNPVANTWTQTTEAESPTPRKRASAVWTGEEVIVWGGHDGARPTASGGRYDPAGDGWKPTSLFARSDASAIWTGSELIAWGGVDGYAYLTTGVRYDPATDSWRDLPNMGAPAPRSGTAAVWTGTEMIVWGGYNPYAGTVLSTGARYDPTLDLWSATSVADVPAARQRHTAVWTGSEMIVWGGSGIAGSLQDGGRYAPASDQWRTISTTNAPQARSRHVAVWSGSEMLVWGGFDGSTQIATGGRYEPIGQHWQPLPMLGAPTRREFATAIWTGDEMIVWGGYNATNRDLATGGRYNVTTQQWSDMTTTDAPEARRNHSAIWTGSEMIVWGGYGNLRYFQTGGRYDPAGDGWTAMSTTDAPDGRAGHAVAWTGTEMVVVGGFGDTGYTSIGGRYCAAPCLVPTTSYRDLDGDGYGDPRKLGHTCDGSFPAGYVATGTDCDDTDQARHPGAVETCNGIDDDCDDVVDDVAAPTGAPHILSEKPSADTVRLHWSAVSGATGYDVVRGSLAALLETAGDFTAAIDACLGDDFGGTSVDDAEPTPQPGFFYLSRAVNCTGNGSYDSGAPSQAGARDAEIDASPSACP